MSVNNLFVVSKIELLMAQYWIGFELVESHCLFEGYAM